MTQAAGDWWAFVTLMDAHAQREVSIEVDPPGSVAVFRSGLDAHLLRASDLASEAYVRSGSAATANAKVEGGIEVGQGFLGAFAPHRFLAGATIGAAFAGPDGPLWECGASTSTVVVGTSLTSFCGLGWRGYGPAGDYRYALASELKAGPSGADLPILAYVDTQPLL